MLNEKHAIVADILSREMNDESLLPELPPELPPSDIGVTRECAPPVGFADIPALECTVSMVAVPGGASALFNQTVTVLILISAVPRQP
jgi:hypothetical protein